MKGVDAIAHTSSPFHENPKSVEGTFPSRQTWLLMLTRITRFLRACCTGHNWNSRKRTQERVSSPSKLTFYHADAEERPQVKRIVITSSTAAVITPRPGSSTFSEVDWNQASIKEVEELGMDAHPMAIYRASKTLAEKCMSGHVCSAVFSYPAAAWKWYDENKGNVTWDISFINPPFVRASITCYKYSAR